MITASQFDTSPFILSPFEAERKSAILPSSLGYDGTGDRAFIRLHPISARQEGEL